MKNHFGSLILAFGLVGVCISGKDDYHMHLSGECEQLRIELEGSDTPANKLTKLNAFFDTLGSNVQKDFWALVEEAKTEASTSLPSDESKAVATAVITDFSTGALFAPHDEIAAKLRDQFKSLNEPDRLAVKALAKKYGKQLKTLIFPLLPATCKATAPGADQAAAAATQASGFDNPNYQTRDKRHAEFIDSLTAAFREYRRRRNV